MSDEQIVYVMNSSSCSLPVHSGPKNLLGEEWLQFAWIYMLFSKFGYI